MQKCPLLKCCAASYFLIRFAKPASQLAVEVISNCPMADAVLAESLDKASGQLLSASGCIAEELDASRNSCMLKVQF